VFHAFSSHVKRVANHDMLALNKLEMLKRVANHATLLTLPRSLSSCPKYVISYVLFLALLVLAISYISYITRYHGH